MTEKLIEIKGMSSMNASQLASALCDWFGENGSIAFEHGYKATLLSVDGVPMAPVYVDRNGIHCYAYCDKANKRVVKFRELDLNALHNFIDDCEMYYRYCLTEA